MSQRGLKTVESRAAQAMLASRYALVPPPGMSAAELAIWDEVTQNVPAGWIPHESTQVLVSYCRHAVQAQLIDQQIARLSGDMLSEPDGLKLYAELLRLRKMQTDGMNTTGGSLRLTTRAQRRAAGTGETVTARERATSKPWAT